MKRLIILAVLLIHFPLTAKTWTTKEDQLKSCMMAIYLSQSTFHQNNQTFTKNLADLKLAKSEECNGMEIKLTKASLDIFEAEVSSQNSIWIIDSSKSMKKLR